MATYIHKDTRTTYPSMGGAQFRTPAYYKVDASNQVFTGVESRYWKFEGDPVELLEMTQAEKAEADAPVVSSMVQGKKDAINSKTTEIIRAGIEHNGVIFDVEQHDQISLIGVCTLSILSIMQTNGLIPPPDLPVLDMAGQIFRARDETYVFKDNADAISLLVTGLTHISTTVYAGASLKDQVIALDLTGKTITEARQDLDKIADTRAFAVSS